MFQRFSRAVLSLLGKLVFIVIVTTLVLVTQSNFPIIQLTKPGSNLTLIRNLLVTSEPSIGSGSKTTSYQKTQADLKEKEETNNTREDVRDGDTAFPSAPSGHTDDLQIQGIPAPKEAESGTGIVLKIGTALPPVFTAGAYTYEAPLNVNLRIQEGGVVPTSTNVTPPDGRVLIYNRVPKCGSSTMLEIIRSLARRNGFNHVSSGAYFTRSLSYTEQRDLLVNLYSERGWPVKYPAGVYQRNRKTGLLSYEQHFFFFNATRHHYPRPAWINIVREPAARFVSNFYYARSFRRWNAAGHLKGLLTPVESWFNKTLDVCLAEGDPECFPARGKMRELQLTYFCGQHPGCLQIGNSGALQRAKRHVEMYYSVVGITEEFSLSIKVLQEYVPGFFFNATAAALASGKVKRNKASSSSVVSPNTLKRLRDLLQEDVEFYDFVKQRLHKQAESVGIL